MNIFKKICDKLFPGYKENEQEQKVTEIVKQLLKSPSTTRILYNSGDAFFVNEENNIRLAVEGNRITIISKSDYYEMNGTGRFIDKIEKILDNSVHTCIEDMFEKTEDMKTKVLEGIINEMYYNEKVHEIENV